MAGQFRRLVDRKTYRAMHSKFYDTVRPEVRAAWARQKMEADRARTQ